MKTVLILLMFLNHEPAGQYSPSPVFDSMNECVAEVRAHIPELTEYPDSATKDVTRFRAYCINENQVKEVELK